MIDRPKGLRRWQIPWLAAAALAFLLAGCGAGGTPTGAPPGGAPGVTAEPTSTSPSAAQGTGGASPPATGAAATSPVPGTASPGSTASGSGAPLTIPLVTSLGGVPASPLPDTAANAKVNAQYACRWYSELAEVLADASSRGNVAEQGRDDIGQITAFAKSAGTGDHAYAKLASDAAALAQPAWLAKLAHPLNLLRDPHVAALGADCN